MTTGEYGGIGSLIRQRNNEGGVMIAEPTEGMPADLAGLKPGDLILAIDTIDVSKATNSRVSELLKGVPNTKMVLTIQRPGEKKPRKFEITRKQITTPQVTYYGVKNDSIGYIYLKAFTIKSAQDSIPYKDLNQPTLPRFPAERFYPHPLNPRRTSLLLSIKN